MTHGAKLATLDEATTFKSTVFETSSAIASKRATRNSWSTKRFIRATSLFNLAILPLPSIASSAPVMIANGVEARGRHWP